jgi:hypothetical protein
LGYHRGMTNRLSYFFGLSLLLVPIACTDDGNTDTGSTTTDSETLCHCDATTAEEDTDPTAGDGDGDPTTGDGDPTTGDGSFAEVYQVFVEDGCTAGYCHGADANGLTMTDEATSYMNLVGVDATTAACDLTQRVVAGEPDQSILWMRVRPAALDGGMPCAIKMPNDGTDNGLPEADAQIVYDWIAAGALP